MKISFSLTMSTGIHKLKPIFDEVENELNSLFTKNNYGNGLKEVFIGLICVTTEFDEFFKPGKPKYFENEEMKVDEHKFQLIKSLEYQIKLDTTLLMNSNGTEIKDLILSKLITTLPPILKAESKIKDFNVELLVHELKGLL